MTEAVLLVGGQGTRLRPLTINTPKPMLPVAGVPCTEHQIARAREAGVTRIVLGTSYKAEVFRDYFGDGAKFGVELIYAVEDHPMGTGGAIRHVAEHLLSGPDDPVMVFNGDVLSGVDLRPPVRGARRDRGRRHAVPDPGRRSAGVRPGADGRRRPGHRVPGEAQDRRRDHHRPDQRRLLRVPALGHRRHPHRPAGLGGARDLPEAAGRGRAAAGRRRRGVLAGPGQPAGVREGLGGPRARHRPVPGGPRAHGRVPRDARRGGVAQGGAGRRHGRRRRGPPSARTPR